MRRIFTAHRQEMQTIAGSTQGRTTVGTSTYSQLKGRCWSTPVVLKFNGSLSTIPISCGLGNRLEGGVV